MTSANWKRVQDLFELLEPLPAVERQACLEREEPDEELRAETLRLLESARLEEQAQQRLTAERVPASSPERVGAFRILSTLGAGGFSTVYSAARLVNGMEQRVALKLFHAHRLGDDARRRFEREQRMLASLDHSGIVRFLDAGVTAEGRPYLVMEEVAGTTITEHCARLNLGTAVRLKLIEDACRALQEAHRQLIVHLDLKPSNILVTGEGQVKLLDFGTAKLMDETGAPTVTQQLTPLYASPERLRGEPGSVSCDIYSLGLVLCELLSDQWPFPDRESLSSISARAQGTLTPDAKLTGDLRAICMKALAHEPAERYGSVAELMEDLRRYHAGEPVLAHAPGILYRGRKFVRRNLRALAGTAAVGMLLLGAAAYAWRQRIEGAQRLEEARGMAKYLLFDLYDRINELPGSTAVRAHMAGQAQLQLDKLSRLAGAGVEIRLEAAAGYDRLAEIQAVSGTSSLGNAQAATQNLGNARALLDAILASNPVHRAARVESAHNALLGAKLQNWNSRNTAAARPLVELARRELDKAGGAFDLSWARARSSLAIQEADLFEFDRDYAGQRRVAAAALAELAAWPADRRSGSDYLLRRVALLKRSGNAAYYQQQFAGALACYREAHDRLREYDGEHPNRPEILYALMDMSYQMAYSLGELKQPQAMLAATRESLAIGARLLEYDGGNSALRRSYWNKRQALAESLAELGRMAEAVEEQEAVLAARGAARLAQPDSNLASEDVLVSEATLARLLAKMGQKVKACALARGSLDRSRALHDGGGMTEKNWAEQQRSLGRILKENCGR